jgi:hypothetical protein
MDTFQITYQLFYQDKAAVKIRAKSATQALVKLGQQLTASGDIKIVSSIGTPIPTRLL